MDVLFPELIVLVHAQALGLTMEQASGPRCARTGTNQQKPPHMAQAEALVAAEQPHQTPLFASPFTPAH